MWLSVHKYLLQSAFDAETMATVQELKNVCQADRYYSQTFEYSSRALGPMFMSGNPKSEEFNLRHNDPMAAYIAKVSLNTVHLPRSTLIEPEKGQESLVSQVESFD